jgi:hypothetical protein
MLEGGIRKAGSMTCLVDNDVLGLESLTSPARKQVQGEFGCCSLTFESKGSSPNFELGHLIIGFDSSKPTSAEDTARLLETLDGVFNLDVDFAVTCDLRLGHPSAQLAISIGRFLQHNHGRWSRHVMSMAVLITGNIFVAFAQGVLVKILTMWFPSCPAIVCHCEYIAKEFFVAHTSNSSIGREFVSVVKVRQECVDLCDEKDYCSAFVAPLRPWEVNHVSSSIESTIHILPNGDLRVIQSPADDIIRDTTKELPKGCAGKALSALKFEGMERDLAPLIGTHFHIGELIADADIESEARHLLRQQSDEMALNAPPGCLDAVLRMIGRICGGTPKKPDCDYQPKGPERNGTQPLFGGPQPKSTARNNRSLSR